MAGREWDREREWDRSRRYRGESDYDRPGGRDREYGRRQDERGFLERLRDELGAWFGDESASRERWREERDTGRWGGPEETDRDWARQWGYVEGRGPRRGDRRSTRGWGVGEYGGPEYWSGDVRAPGGGWGWSEPERPWRPASWWSPGAAREGRRDMERERDEAATRRGSFAGRGPRGYHRSDERIREEICERMCDSADLDASGIEILVVGGEVTLQGTVDERHDKRLAEDLTEGVSGVRDVHNQLRVAAAGQERQQPPEPQSRPGETPRHRAA